MVTSRLLEDADIFAPKRIVNQWGKHEFKCRTSWWMFLWIFKQHQCLRMRIQQVTKNKARDEECVWKSQKRASPLKACSVHSWRHLTQCLTGISHQLANCFGLRNSTLFSHGSLSVSYVPGRELGTKNTKVSADKPVLQEPRGRVAGRLNRQFQCSLISASWGLRVELSLS